MKQSCKYMFIYICFSICCYTISSATPNTNIGISKDVLSQRQDFTLIKAQNNEVLVKEMLNKISDWILTLDLSSNNITGVKDTLRSSIFINGNLVVNFQSTSDISVQEVAVAGKHTGGNAANCFVGNIDDLVIDNIAPYNTAYSAPGEEIPVTTSNSDSVLVKFDRLHSKRGTFTLSGVTKYTDIAFTDIELSTTWVDLGLSALSAWVPGAGGLQILDMSQVIATLNPSTYTFTTNKFELNLNY